MSKTVQPESAEQVPPRFELERIDDYSQYLLHARLEILAVLRSLIQKNALVTVHFDQGNAFFLTSLLAIEPETNRIIVDVGSDEETNTRALRADKLIFTAVVDKIKIQFSITALARAEHEARPAFVGSIPDTLLRLQRREFFRLATPIAAPIRLFTSIPRPAAPLQLDVPLLDISGGGVGMMLTPEQASLLQIGDVLENCRITLPGEGLLATTLGVRNLFDVTTRSGARHVRVGCEYIDLPNARLSAIQRYITHVERERKARLSGLA